MSLFGMMVVDAFLLAEGIQDGRQHCCTPRTFFEDLATELIDNTFDTISLRKRRATEPPPSPGPSDKPIMASSIGQLNSPTPTKRMKKANPKHRSQGRCVTCKKPASHVCRECQRHHQEKDAKQCWICNKEGKACMGSHILECHPAMVAEE